MTNSNAKGDRRERELRNYYREIEGHVPLRMPASGGGTDMKLPDLLVGRETHVPLAQELKAAQAGDIIYIPQDEAEDLVDFAESFGAKPEVVGRWDRDTTYYRVAVQRCPTTESGNLKLDYDTAVEEFWRVEKP